MAGGLVSGSMSEGCGGGVGVLEESLSMSTAVKDRVYVNPEPPLTVKLCWFAASNVSKDYCSSTSTLLRGMSSRAEKRSIRLWSLEMFRSLGSTGPNMLSRRSKAENAIAYACAHRRVMQSAAK